ncbi:hypothetical protein [Kineococcus sp. SYSU DK003]|uniref:hypothetical protein n=1 Tax=Kineococcus sp. SYSU DK003 TaxID=3383124 RepID=UPI003D7EADC9
MEPLLRPHRKPAPLPVVGSSANDTQETVEDPPHPAATSARATPSDQLPRAVGAIMLVGLPVTILLRPEASSEALGVMGACGLALFGIDKPWSRVIQDVKNRVHG